MVVDKNLSIIGVDTPDKVIIDAKSLGIHFKVISGVFVTFKNITFINGETPYQTSTGSISIFESTANIDNCRFINNTAGWVGGAIDCEGSSYFKQSYLTITNSIFEGNYAAHDGGAITSYYAQTTIKNCEFYNNSVGRDGGAIRVKFCQYHMIDNCTFMYNRALGGNGWGGAVYTWSDVDSYIKNSYFAYNRADEAGGAITSGSRVVITNCTIVDNFAGWMGGGIYIYEEGVPTSAFVNYNNIYDNNIPNVDLFGYEGRDVCIRDTVTEGSILNFNDNYWGTNNPFNATDYPYSWAKRFYTSGVSVNLTTWIVKDAESKLIAQNISLYYKNGTKYTVRLLGINDLGLANQKLIISINGINYTLKTDSSGYSRLSINLNPGKYEISVVFNKSEQYKNSSIINTVTVIPTIDAENILKYFRNGTNFKVKLLDGNGSPIIASIARANINGVFYDLKTNLEGIGQLSINLNPGNYIITVENTIDNLYRSFNITVLSILEAENIVKYYKNGTQYSVKVLDCNGNPLANAKVQYNINGVFYSVYSNNNGIATLNINLNPGDYIVTAFYNDCYISNKIKVLSFIKSQDIEMTTSKRVPFTATILNDVGAILANVDVSFNINGIFYHTKTDNNGVASLDINLKQGTYIITTIFNGLCNSNKIKIV